MLLTINQYDDIQEVLKENVSLTEKCMLIQNYLGIRDYTDSFWDECTYTEIVKEIKSIEYVFKTDPIKPPSGIPINSMSFGKYIDVFQAFKTDKNKFMEELECEPFQNYYLWYAKEFTDYYTLLKTKHTLIYVEPEEVISDDEIERIENAVEKTQAINEKKKQNNQKTFSWLSMVYMLCDGDISKYNTVISTSNNLVHNWISYKLGLEKGYI